MTQPLVTDSEIAAARTRIESRVVRTPTLASSGLSELLDADVHCKAELLQLTGSFKVRGVFNKVLSLDQTERSRGILAFSAGNHAMAVAHVAKTLHIPVTVCMPAGAVQFKVDAVRALGASLELVEGDLVAHALNRREQLGATLVHPFDDPAIIAGHASLGLEIVEDLPDVETVIVPVGGGGLISAVATAVKRAKLNVRVIGVEPDTADVVRLSQLAGNPVALGHPQSLADGLNAPITGQINLDHIDAYVDEMVIVPEHSIRQAWRDLLNIAKLAGEPAAAAGIAAIGSGAISLRSDEKVCLVISGGNADFDKLNG